MDGATATELTNKLTEHLKEILSDNKVKATVLPASQDRHIYHITKLI